MLGRSQVDQFAFGLQRNWLLQPHRTTSHLAPIFRRHRYNNPRHRMSSSRSVSPPPIKRQCRRRRSLSDQVEPTPRSLRIFSWNINGVNPFLQPSILDSFLRSDDKRGTAASVSLRSFLRRQDWPEILNLQEVKINPSDTATQRRVQNAVNDGQDGGPSYVVHFCLPRDQYNATGFGRKVYGVASIIRQDFYDQHVEQVREVTWDLEGRILVIETSLDLCIWNIYAVNGTDAPYKNSSGAVMGTRHDRKLAFHKLLVEECLKIEQQVILTGDLNVARQQIDGHPRLRTSPQQHVRNRKDFNDKFFDDPEGLMLIDTFRCVHPEKKSYSWMSRSRPWMESCDRVDYILVSSRLQDRVVYADILMDPVERGPSDHFPVYLDLRL